MALRESSLSDISLRFKPHLLMVAVQLSYTFVYFITEASFNHGMNPHVYVTYRHIVGGVLLFPFAYFLERKTRPKLTVALFVEIFILSLLAVGLTLNTYFAALRYTSPTLVASVWNGTSALTFVIAIVLRLETLDLRDTRSIAEVLGTLLSLAGVTIMTTYKGPIMGNLWHPLIHTQRHNKIHEQWLKGSLLAVSSCITWSMLNIIQAITLRRYPARLSLSTWMCFLGAVESAFFTVIVEHKPATWRIGFNIDFWSTVYGGVVSGLTLFFQLWCTEERGPVFVTMFSPVSTILAAILAYFVFGEKLSLGSIIGAFIVVVGVYLLLWGKERDGGIHVKKNERSFLADDEMRDTKIRKSSSAEKDLPEGEP